MRPRTPLAVIALHAVVILSCAVPGQAPPPGDTPPPATPPAEPTPGPEPLPPSDFVAVLDAEVAAGEIAYEEGLIRLLRAILGDPEVTLPAAYDEVTTTEGNSTVERAWDYIASGGDEAARAEMLRLLELIVPSPGALEAYSRPAEAAAGGAGLARRVGQPPLDCADLWLAGFPLEGVTVYPCFAYRRQAVPGSSTFTVYFPAAWMGDAALLPWFERTREAAYNSLSTLADFGPFDDVSLIFSTVNHAAAAYLATTHPYLDSLRETCPILIYPAALSLGAAEFEQIIAHEIFHCWQFNNLEAQMQVPQQIKMWWSEGTAEYFSNFVYPTTNYEYRWVPGFDSLSPSTPLYEMGYETFGFWQFLANRWGDNGVISLLELMPAAGGVAEQQDRLAATPGMGDVFHDFGKAYLDLAIADPGGATIPFVPHFDSSLEVPRGSFHEEFAPEAFVLDRHELFFVDDTRFDVRRQQTEGEGRDSANAGARPGAWGTLPPRVNTACGEGEYVLLVTSAQASGEPPMTLAVDATGEPLEQDVDCEACLIGTWQLDNNSFFRHMGGLVPIVVAGLPAGLPGSGVEVFPTSVFGTMTLTFHDDGTAEGEQAGWGIAAKATGREGAIEMAFIYNGAGAATWRVEVDDEPEQRYLFFDSGEFALIAEQVVEGHVLEARPTGGSNDPIFLRAPQPFTCSDTTLTYHADDPMGPIWFVRTSEVIDAP